jgi:hypothetical protein
MENICQPSDCGVGNDAPMLPACNSFQSNIMVRSINCPVSGPSSHNLLSDPPGATCHCTRLGHNKDAQDARHFDLEVYAFMRSRECERLPNSQYFDEQTSARPMMRAVIVDWLIEMHKNLKMHTDNLFTAVELFDLVLSRMDCPKPLLQLVSSASLLICAKIDEPHPVRVEKLVSMANNGFTTKELTDMEARIFKLLDCQVNPIHSSHFLKRFLRLISASTKRVMIAHFINETALLDEAFIGMVPSLRAAAVIATVLALDRGPGQWTQSLVDNTGYTVHDLQPTIPLLLNAVRKFNRSRLQAIHKKYAIAPLCSVSELEYPESVNLE